MPRRCGRTGAGSASRRGKGPRPQLTAGGQELGQAFLYPGRPSWIYLSLDFDSNAEGGTATSGTVRCELVRQDGSTVPVGEVHLAEGYGGWCAPVPVDRGPPTAARVIGSTGAILAAHFG